MLERTFGCIPADGVLDVTSGDGGYMSGAAGMMQVSWNVPEIAMWHNKFVVARRDLCGGVGRYRAAHAEILEMALPRILSVLRVRTGVGADSAQCAVLV